MNDSTEERAERARLVREWVRKAESDLRVCKVLMRERSQDDLYDGACFHAEQCVEKMIKAVLVWRNIDFEKTHDIPVLVSLMPQDDRPTLSAQEQGELKSYAVDARYTLDVSYTEKDALSAIRGAQTTRDFVVVRLKEVFQI